MLKTFFKEPLIHFIGAGLALFVAYDLVAPPSDASSDPNTIIVDEAALLNFVQFRTRNFDEVTARRRVAELSDDAYDALIKDFVREEALHREAKALGLDDGDYIIRRRLVQKVEYIAQGIADDGIAPDQATIEAYYAENAANYAVDQALTFTHIFFGADANGWSKAEQLAQTMADDLAKSPVPFAAASQHGNLFPYHLNYVDRTPDYVASHFGPDMTATLMTLPANPKQWIGPLKSDHGFHLVMLTKNADGYTPALDEVRGQILRDVERTQSERQLDEAIDTIVGQYDVEVTTDKSSIAPGGPAR